MTFDEKLKNMETITKNSIYYSITNKIVYEK